MSEDANTGSPARPPSTADDLNPLSGAVETLAERFATHPGFMWTGSGFEVLHADWPAYPVGHGLAAAVRALAEYPGGTCFYQIDQIDRCTLFLVGRQPDKDAFAAHFLHVAVWDDDLRDCAQRKYVERIEDDGTFLQFPDKFIVLTPEGSHAALILDLTRDVDPNLLATVDDLLLSHRYDSAVREAAIHVEMAMRQATGSSAFGQKLVDQCFGVSGVLVPEKLPNTHRLGLRSAFQAYFAYVRNEYAHNFPPTDIVTACRLLRRSAELICIVHELAAMKVSNREDR